MWSELGPASPHLDLLHSGHLQSHTLLATLLPGSARLSRVDAELSFSFVTQSATAIMAFLSLVQVKSSAFYVLQKLTLQIGQRRIDILLFPGSWIKIVLLSTGSIMLLRKFQKSVQGHLAPGRCTSKSHLC